MLDPVIQNFFDNRKQDWLDKKIISSMSDGEINVIKDEGEKRFAPKYWIPEASKRAGQISISTHPCTFSHPSARKNFNGDVTSIIAKANYRPDGYLRSGNVIVENDAVGNAAALDVYRFLTLSLQDGRSLLEHITHDSDQAIELLTIPLESYEKLKENFLSMVKNRDFDAITSSKIKQVYFPVDGDQYHLLSMLSNSGLIYKLRKRIDESRFSEKQKEFREKKRNKQFSEVGFSEIYDITTIGYGGTKPQNISVLNSQYGGKARLLISSPPQLDNRVVHFPTSNFFINSIRYYDIRESLRKLHDIFKSGLKSGIPRKTLEGARDNRIEAILDEIIVRMSRVRAVAAIQYRQESTALPQYQKIWLCSEYQDDRMNQQEWLDELCDKISLWILAAYQKVIKKAVTLGPAEHKYIKEMVATYREVLR